MPLDLQIDCSIINPHYSIPEAQLFSSNTCFNSWFGILFQDELYINHIRVPQPSKILTLYNLYNPIPFYLFILSESIVRQLVLHILSSCLAQELATILPLPNLVQSITSSRHKCIIHFFHVQPMSSSSTWKDSYAADKDTEILMQNLLYHQLVEKATLSSLPAQYRSAVVDNTLGIVEGVVLYCMKQFQQLPTKSVVL